jgi:hypothetical protein
MRTVAPGMAMYKYTEQTIIQWAIPGLLRGPANGQITAPTRRYVVHVPTGLDAVGLMPNGLICVRLAGWSPT